MYAVPCVCMCLRACGCVQFDGRHDNRPTLRLIPTNPHHQNSRGPWPSSSRVTKGFGLPVEDVNSKSPGYPVATLLSPTEVWLVLEIYKGIEDSGWQRRVQGLRHYKGAHE